MWGGDARRNRREGGGRVVGEGDRYYSNARPEMARFIHGRPSRILEIGCAGGCFRSNIFWPCEYWGGEPVPDVAARASQTLSRVLTGTYEAVAAELPEGYFDLIVCNDVIEHMLDPDAFLRSVRTRLNPQGQLVGSVPNVRYLLNLINLLIMKEWRYEAGGVLDATHLRFFTMKSLARLLRETGFRIERLQPVGPDRYLRLKRCLEIVAWWMGTDVLYAQMGFRCRI